MTNRKQRRRMSQQKQPSGNPFTAALKAAADKQRQKAQEDHQTEAPQQNVLRTSKPDSQQIGQTTIQWVWEKERYVVTTNYWLVEPNIEQVPAGEYTVRLDLDTTDYSLTPNEARELALTMLSAYEWSTNWQQHMGEFLAVQPKPPLKVVDENVNDAVDYEDNRDDDEISDEDA